MKKEVLDLPEGMKVNRHVKVILSFLPSSSIHLAEGILDFAKGYVH